ncbi:hypothetical protein B0H19DRAFT_1083965 [Mycena capillaripes]|nr:hypothetical protein B0H19DRAFT_1083965 [Mycena capillaripes]
MKGLVLNEIVQAIAAFPDFCYLVRRDDFDEDTLDAVDAAVRNFHHHREILRILNAQGHSGQFDGFYPPSAAFNCASGGACSSITESRHITAVKKPWRRSSRYEALSQMLRTNQRFDKPVAARADFVERGMLPPTHGPPVVDPDDDDGGPVDTVRVEGNVVLARTRERRYPRFASVLAKHINLYSESYADAGIDIDPSDISTTPLSVFRSAGATFYAPSDSSGTHGIQSKPSWRKHGARRDARLLSKIRISLVFVS